MRGNRFKLEPGSHVCHLFDSFGEQKEVALPFVRDGLANGEHCLYITSDQSVDDWYLEFQAFGIDVYDEVKNGALSVIRGEDWSAAGSDFTTVMKVRETINLIESRLQEFPGLRIAGDASWALNRALETDRLCHWEAANNLVYEGFEVRVICQYGLSKHPAPSIHAALRTHPIVIVEGHKVANPFYEAERILDNEPDLNGSSADAPMVEKMIDRLRA